MTEGREMKREEWRVFQPVNSENTEKPKVGQQKPGLTSNTHAYTYFRFTVMVSIWYWSTTCI